MRPARDARRERHPSSGFFRLQNNKPGVLKRRGDLISDQDLIFGNQNCWRVGEFFGRNYRRPRYARRAHVRRGGR